MVDEPVEQLRNVRLLLEEVARAAAAFELDPDRQPVGRRTLEYQFVGVVVAVIIAWVLVNVLFSLIAFAFRLAAVAVVALIVFFILRAVFARRDVD